ncbi:SPOR domain-containing protein [Neotabrizicola shimadae]|uniref:SPOR domain-containing protein n=1 Tax=Neotabrizicola shimadae TaxID=2807096 RepID=A0A8G0ZNL3_9RHOB|nr:SPOR domain-containing protein [Neotabrizicola shimadae]QYZ68656.1 SPOR domain-containing protein [Neotabrizicola shimadae]
MADVEYDEVGAVDAPMRPHRVQRLVHLAGALTSIALVLGLGYWGYRIAVRDISGVPVVRALEGPLRMAPENPGGEITLHQGLAVNAIPEAGMAEPVADQIALAPRAQELAEEDMPGLVQAPETVAAVPAVAPGSAGVVTPPPVLPAAAAVSPIEDPEQSVADTATGEDLEAALAAAEAPLMDPETGAEPAVEDVAEEPAANEPVENPAVAKSVRPPARPARLEGVAATAAPSTDAPGPAAPPRVVDPATLKIGTRLVQFGAYDSPEAAEADWTRIATQFAELMAGKGMVVQAAQSGGRAFWRLRAEGFEDDADARRFCAALQAENATCIPVVWR